VTVIELSGGMDITATHTLKIDGYAHISPPRYTQALRTEFPGFYNQILGRTPALSDMGARFRIMDAFAPLAQVLTVGPVPPLEHFADPRRAAPLARLANDEMAELVATYPDRFVAAIALLPMNDIDAALAEAERAISELGFKGIYVHSNINGKPLDAPEFLPFFEMAVAHGLPIYIHPWRGNGAISSHLTKPPIEYFRMFYVDTAIHGNTPALMLANSFWGADKLLFAADMPLGDPDFGMSSYAKTIGAIEAMDISAEDKGKILGGNVARLLGLTPVVKLTPQAG
jgi:predicted TIM-barrel fold metal-dependent hydrolase